MRLAIIGCAGRNTNQLNKLSASTMQYMYDNVMLYISCVLELLPENIILVSGGSAWSDHVAIQLYLQEKFAGLELYIPANFDTNNKKFEDSYEGKILNSLHESFAKKINYDVFQELYDVINDPNVKVIFKKGFFQRNTLISQNNDCLLAFTFDEIKPLSGGTFDTWNKTKHQNKIHFSLAN